MLKYLLGILIIQAATVAMTLAAAKSDDQELWLAVSLLGVVIALVTSLWFASIAKLIKKDALASANDAFSKEREKLRVNAERQKSRLIQKSHEEIRKETNRAHAKSSFKLGAGFIGIVGAGSLMIFSQFLTLGLLTLAIGGGGLGGYLMRIRHEVSARQKKAFAMSDENKSVSDTKKLKSDSN